MNDIEITVRKNIANCLLGISESILKKNPPFEDIPVHHEVSTTYYRKCFEYFNVIDVELRERVISRQIDYAKMLINTKLVKPETLKDSGRYVQHEETKKLISNWLLKHEGNNVKEDFTLKKKEKILWIGRKIKHFFEKYNSKFDYDPFFKNEKNVYPFSIPFLNENKIVVYVEKDRLGSNLNFCIGALYPNFLIDIAMFYGRPQSSFQFWSLEELEEQFRRAICLIEIILPYFMKCIEKAITDA